MVKEKNIKEIDRDISIIKSGKFIVLIICLVIAVILFLPFVHMLQADLAPLH